MKKIELEERGYFWWRNEPTPEGHFAPDSAVTGVLSIDEDGRVELELDGVLFTEEEALAAVLGELGPIPPDKAIQGILKGSGYCVVLTGIWSNGGRGSTNGISFQRFSALSCLVGSSPPPLGVLRFRKLEIDLKGLESWLRLGSISFNRTKSRLSSTYRRPKNLSYPAGDGALSIKYDITAPYFGTRKSELSLSESAALCFTTKKSWPLLEMRDLYGVIEDLFILLTDSECCLEWPLLKLWGSKNSYRYYFLRNRSAAPAPDWHECWTNFVQLKDNFGAIFSSWRTQREIFGPGFYLYLGTRRGMQLYAEHRFVNLMWGIESLHRRSAPESALPTNLEKKIQRILDGVEKKRDRCWLEGKLKHAQEPNLAQRMYETLKELPFAFDESLLRSFCGSCASARNDISHFGGVRHDEGYEELLTSLDSKSDAISLLYHALLLHKIGVDKKILRWWMFEGFRSYGIKESLADTGLLASNG